MQNSGYGQERKTKNLKSSAKLCDKTIQKLSKIIAQHIALKEEKREQQSLLDQLDTHTKKNKKKRRRTSLNSLYLSDY